MAVMVRAGLGLDPWDVFHQGLAGRTGMTIGIASAVVGVAVLLAWIPLRNRPGIGTVANVIVIAITVDAALALLPEPTGLPAADRDDARRRAAQRRQHRALHRRGPRARPARRSDDRTGGADRTVGPAGAHAHRSDRADRRVAARRHRRRRHPRLRVRHRPAGAAGPADRRRHGGSPRADGRSPNPA